MKNENAKKTKILSTKKIVIFVLTSFSMMNKKFKTQNLPKTTRKTKNVCFQQEFSIFIIGFIIMKA